MAHIFCGRQYAFHVDNLRTVRNCGCMDTEIDLSAATDAIIEAFGGITAMARAMGHKNPSTVQGWKSRGAIPVQQQPEVLACAKRENIPLGPEHFLSPFRGKAAA